MASLDTARLTETPIFHFSAFIRSVFDPLGSSRLSVVFIEPRGVRKKEPYWFNKTSFLVAARGTPLGIFYDLASLAGQRRRGNRLILTR
jgi:hypothetical protein